MSGDIASLVASVGTTFSIAKAVIAERDGQKLGELRAQLTDQVLEGQAKLAQAIALSFEKDATINELRRRVEELEVQSKERARYQLAKLGTVGEFFAYKLRAAGELQERADEPEHFLCQPCFDTGRKGVLHLGTFAACPLCKVQRRIRPDRPLSQR